MEGIDDQMKVEEEARQEKTSWTKRAYEPPQLVKWGSMVNLTLGPEFLFDDVDAGGSEFV